MSIEFDASANGVNTAATSLTFSHTCTGNNLILLVGASIDSENNWITGITYNGVSMTLIRAATNVGSNQTIRFFYLISPATGANNIVISTSNSTNIRGVSASYTGTRQTNQPDANSTATTDGATSITDSVTVVAGNAWAVSVSRNTVGAPTAGTGLTLRTNSASLGIGDSNGVASGSYSMTWQGSSADWAMVSASIAPVPEGGAALFAL